MSDSLEPVLLTRQLRHGVDKTVNPGYDRLVGFGELLRELRTTAGVGIKRLGPELGVTYSYVSKLENNEVNPSEELVGRIADYFHYDRDRLLIAAGKVPPEILRILQEHPEDAIDFLRKRFGGA
jgi:transcriptional regulator with XRE-family HTH domain